MANAVLLIHAGFVLFVVLGLVLIVLGGACRWPWVRNPWFRVTHVAAIGIVVAESWLGIACPLTTMEMTLRAQSGGPVYDESFITHWVRTLLFYEAPPWVFTVAYTAFAACVIASWIAVRPQRFGAHARRQGRTPQA